MTAAADFDEARRLHRKQFALGPEPIEHPGWTVTRIANDLWLSVHPDLRVTESRRHGAHFVLLGYALAPCAPEASDQQVLDDLAERSRSFADLLRNSQPLGGRFALVHDDGATVRVFNDAIGSRQVFYTRAGGQPWCMAQPKLLADRLDLARDEAPLVRSYLDSVVFGQNQGFWPGDGSVYAGVRHLQPNHYLDVRRSVVTRFWPDRPLTRMTVDEAVPAAAEILTGTLRAAAHRGPLMLTVTAGWDSRMILAASRSIASQVYYFVQRLKPVAYAIDYDPEPDIRVPSKLLKQLGFDFHVLDSTAPPDEAFSRVFDASVALARDSAKPGLYALRGHEDRVRVIGLASEIARVKYPALRRWKATPRLLAEIEHAGHPYAEARLGEWLQDTDEAEERYGVPVLDLFAWEQKHGNWAAHGSAEGDIIGEELVPFNNRELLATLLSVELKHRAAPGCRLQKQLLRYMWPETLRAPINPEPLRERLKHGVKDILRDLLGNTPLWQYLRTRQTRAKLSQYLARTAADERSAANVRNPGPDK